MVRVAVIGAGVVGLSTAANIQTKIPTADVTIISDRFDIHTTSNVAAGVFRCYLKDILGVPRERASRWRDDSFAHYSALALSDKSGESGCYVLHGYVFYDKPIDSTLNDCIFSCHELTTEQKRKLNQNSKHGYLMATCLTECRKYLPWLMLRFKSKGGHVVNKKVEDMNELVDRYDIVVNCSGFGSRELLTDEQVYPIRGQVMRVTAPWIKYYMYDGKSAYIYPNSDSVVIGGTRQKNNFSTAVDPKDTDDIEQRVGDFMPSIKGYEMQSAWVGLRPARSMIRVEKEIMHLGNGPLHVVHNYGHGGNGVALSWGTAVYAAGLVEETVHDAAFMKSKL